MKLKKIISGFLAFSLAISCTAIMPKTALASTATVSQTIFELDIEAMVAGEIPEGTILNSDILDSANSSNENGLISNKVTKETEFLKIDFAGIAQNAPGEGTGLYTIELVTNLNDSDSSTKNGTLMYINGAADKFAFRARESSDFCVMNSSWAQPAWNVGTGAEAHYTIKDMDLSTGAAASHLAQRKTGTTLSNQYSSTATGEALNASNAPIKGITFKAAANYRANIKSIIIKREAIVPVVYYTIGAETEDSEKGSVTVSATSVQTGDSVTLTAIPEENHIFDGWYDGEELVSTESEWKFYPAESKNYVAKFIYVKALDIRAKSADESKGTVTLSPEEPYFENSEITLKATANSGYVFEGWYLDGEKVSSNETYVIIASGETEGEYIAKFISAAFEEQEVYTFDIAGILDGTAELPTGITLNNDILDDVASGGDGTLKSEAMQGAESFITIDLEALVEGLDLEGVDSGVYKAELAVNVKDEDDAINGTDLFAVNKGGDKQLITASETSGVMVSKGNGMNGGGDSYKRTFVTYAFELNVTDGTLTSMLTDQTGSNIFSSVGNGQTVTIPGINGNDPITKLVIKNIAGQRANIKGLKISRNIALVDYGNDTPIFNETCVKLYDANGDIVSGNYVTAAIKTIAIDFRSVLSEETVTIDTIYLEENGEKLDIVPVHNDGIVAFDVAGLKPGASYTVYVASGVKNTDGVSVRNPGKYSFTTKGGEVKAEILDVTDIAGIESGDEIEVKVNYINTNLEENDLYIAYLAYKGNELADVKVAEFKDIDYTIKSEFAATFTAGDMTDVTSVKIFALSSWNDMLPLDSEVYGDVAYTENAEETKVIVNNEENKIVVSAIADDEDEILIEVVAGDKEHSQVFEGLTKAGNIYDEDIPVAFFDIVSGSFTIEVSLADSGEYAVYVKNITKNEMLVDGKVVTFTDAGSYEELANSLDTSSEEAFKASLTDEVATQLGLDILAGNVLSDEEKAEVKALVYAEGLSSIDANSNKKMVSEYATMVVVNKNSEIADEKAIAIADCIKDNVISDEKLKEWYNKYVTDDENKVSFIKKLLSTEKTGTSKIAERNNVLDAIKVAVVLVIAKAPNGYTNIKDSFGDFKSSFGRGSISTKNSVYQKLIGDYANKTAFLRKYDSLVKDSSQGSGGGGSSSGGGFVIEPTTDPKKPGESAPTQPVPTPIEKKIFTDIDTVPWAEEAIVALKIKNVISGKTETEFCPSDNITREEFTKLIVAAFASDVENAELTFSDAKADAWYYGYIQKAKGAGLVSGISDSCFGVGQNITRQDMAVMIFNAAKYKNVVGNSEPEQFPFSDDRSISDYAKEAVYTLKTMGIVSGVDADNFAPKATATRAEAAVMIYRLLQR